MMDQWLRYHVHAGAVSINKIEVRKLLWIRNRSNQAIQLQPLGWEIVAKPTRSPIIQHPVNLCAEHFRITQLAGLGKVEQRVVRNAAPEEQGQSRGQLEITDALTAAAFVV